jgi:hypothetical protein
MFLHSIADVPLEMVRVFIETTFMTPTVIGIILMTSSWFYTRLWVFPQVITGYYQNAIFDRNVFIME